LVFVSIALALMEILVDCDLTSNVMYSGLIL
jgi:hypothetical protein